MTTEIVVSETPPVTADETSPPLPDVAPLADAAVEVARIEGETQIALAEIRAETEVAAIEQAAENTENDAWRRSIETQIMETRETLQSILSKLTPAEPAPPNPESESVAALPVADEQQPTQETQTEKPKVNKRRWI